MKHTPVTASTVITTNAGSGATLKVSTKSANEIMVYFPNNSSAGIKNTLSTSAAALWFDPRNGSTQSAGTFTSNQTRSMQPPSGWQDAVLVVTGGGGGSQTPYNGTASSLPGTIQTENFDDGGQGVAYHDTEALNQGSATSYRPGEGVDISNSSEGGYHVGYVAAGEWLEYTVNVAATGTYSLNVRVASLSGGGSLRVEVDGVNKSGTVNVPSTGSWTTWQTLTVNGISLTAGQRLVRIYFIAPGFNLNWISFVSTGGGGSAVVIVDNTDTASVTTVGSWPASTASGGVPG